MDHLILLGLQLALVEMAFGIWHLALALAFAFALGFVSEHCNGLYRYWCWITGKSTTNMHLSLIFLYVSTSAVVGCKTNFQLNLQSRTTLSSNQTIQRTEFTRWNIFRTT